MIKIDDSLLEEIGLISLPKPERDQMLRQIYETLEMRVGMRLAERMSDQQLDEFERFIDTNDEAGALKWLETNFPDYKQVVADELEKLKSEIKKDSGRIIEAMRAQGQVAAPAAPAPQPYSSPAQPLRPAPVQPPNWSAPSSEPAAPVGPTAAPQQFAPQPAPQASPAPSFNPANPGPMQPMSNQSQATSGQPTQDDDSAQPPAAQPSGPSIPPPPGF